MDPTDDLAKMIADYMEAGFLENILDMFRKDHKLCRLVAGLIQDERVRVRLGTTALVEELALYDGASLRQAVADLLPLLGSGNPTVRGDAANLIGIIGGTDAVVHLEKLLSDESPEVRLIAEEALAEIRLKGKGR